MTRDEILSLSEDKKIIELVDKNFEIQLQDLEDSSSLSTAWQIIQKLVQEGWAIDLRLDKDLINVDGYKFHNGPGTIFAQYGFRPNFNTSVEGICKTALIARQTLNELRE